jgi:isocitrate dehydrogenase kinase/phosphatase
MTASVPPTDVTATIDTILEGYHAYRRYFQEITSRAMHRFVGGDWPGLQADANERLDAYQKILQQVVTNLADRLGPLSNDRRLWMGVKQAIASELERETSPDLAETFFNSVVRRLGNIIGADPRLEFLRDEPRPLPPPRTGRDYQSFSAGDSTLETLCGAILHTSVFSSHFQDIEQEARRLAQHLSANGPDAPAPQAIDHIDLLVPPFFRGMGAYLIGRTVTSDGVFHPLAIALINDNGGVTIDGVITDTRGLRLLFSYTHSYFHASTVHIPELIAFLRPLLPHRRLAELYISLGFNRHGKTELYRDLAQHQNACRDIFKISPGKPGMVMAVFNMPTDDLVFKIIRDRFAQPKRTTRREVIAKYDYIFRHDRTGRLPDTQTFEHLRFERGCFHPELIRELEKTAQQSAEITTGHVVIKRSYVERRVHPLDLYLDQAMPEDARSAVIDFGQAIKDLAYSNIFPGDMLLKNFGVTDLGRVIFYDFDEICPLTECRFRRKPAAVSYEDELSSEPWYFVGDNDIFPEEFENFLGLTGELKQVFLTHHRDLFDVDFWQHTQEQLRAGVPIHVFPYKRLEVTPAGSGSCAHRS